MFGILIMVLGVDMSAQPTNYCYMNPEMRIVLDRAVYDDPNVIASRVKTWLSSSADTSPIVVFRKVGDSSVFISAYRQTHPQF